MVWTTNSYFTSKYSGDREVITNTMVTVYYRQAALVVVNLNCQLDRTWITVEIKLWAHVGGTF